MKGISTYLQKRLHTYLYLIVQYLLPFNNQLLRNYKSNLRDLEMLVIDIETTGFNWKKDEIISIGGVCISKGKIMEDTAFEFLVNPLREIPAEIAALTGISNSDILNKPTIDIVLSEIINRTEGKVLVAHGARFDLNFLNFKLKKLKRKKILNPVLDTAVLAERLLPWESSYTLDSLAQKFSIDTTLRHRALGDARITGELLLRFFTLLEQKKITTLQQLHNYLTRQQGLYG